MRDDLDTLVRHLLRKLLANAVLVVVSFAAQTETMASKLLRSSTFPGVSLMAKSPPSLLIERTRLEVAKPAGEGFGLLSNVPEDVVALR